MWKYNVLDTNQKRGEKMTEEKTTQENKLLSTKTGYNQHAGYFRFP